MEVDWNEPPLARWMGTITKKSTRKSYRYAYRKFAQFIGKTATQLIDEAIVDSRKDPRQKQDVVKNTLLQFHRWMREERNTSSNTSNMAVQAIRSFYGTFDIFVKLKGRSSLPTPVVIHKRRRLEAEEVATLVNNARTPRDRAIILTIFQSGMDVSTVCSLHYKDVLVGLESGKTPLRIDTVRQKSGIEYYTFIGRDAVNAIKAYLNDIKSKGIELEADDPLFIKLIQRSDKAITRITTNLIQKMVKETARRAGLANGRRVNPHALRESFSRIMVKAKVPESVVHFWLGHTLGTLAKAYFDVGEEGILQYYTEREALVSITAPKNAIHEDVASLKRLFSDELKKREALEQKVTQLEQKAEEGTFYIDRFKKELEDNPERAGRMYVTLTLWMNANLHKYFKGIDMDELERLREQFET